METRKNLHCTIIILFVYVSSISVLLLTEKNFYQEMNQSAFTGHVALPISTGSDKKVRESEKEPLRNTGFLQEKPPCLLFLKLEQDVGRGSTFPNACFLQSSVRRSDNLHLTCTSLPYQAFPLRGEKIQGKEEKMLFSICYSEQKMQSSK